MPIDPGLLAIQNQARRYPVYTAPRPPAAIRQSPVQVLAQQEQAAQQAMQGQAMQAQAQAQANQPGSFFGVGDQWRATYNPAAPPQAGPGGLLGGLTKGIETLFRPIDMIGNVGLSGIKEISDIFDPRDEASLGQWWEQVKDPEFGMQTLLREAGMKKGLGRSVLGFAGDVLFDPLTYVTAGSSAYMGSAGRTRLAARAAGLGDEAAKAVGLTDDVIRRIGRVGEHALNAEQRAALGLEKAGLRFGLPSANVRIPGTAGLSKGAGQAFGAVRRPFTDTSFGRAMRRLGPGGSRDPRFREAVEYLATGRGPFTSAKNAANVYAGEMEREAAKNMWLGSWRAAANELSDRLAGKTDVARAVERGVSTPDADQFKEFTDLLYTKLHEAGAKGLPKRENFFPHYNTPEFNAWLEKNKVGSVYVDTPGAASGRFKARKFEPYKDITIKGKKIKMGRADIDDITAKLKAAFPDDPELAGMKLFVDDPGEVVARLVDDYAEDVGRAARDLRMEGGGALKEFGAPGTTQEVMVKPKRKMRQKTARRIQMEAKPLYAERQQLTSELNKYMSEAATAVQTQDAALLERATANMSRVNKRLDELSAAEDVIVGQKEVLGQKRAKLQAPDRARAQELQDELERLDGTIQELRTRLANDPNANVSAALRMVEERRATIARTIATGRGATRQKGVVTKRLQRLVNKITRQEQAGERVAQSDLDELMGEVTTAQQRQALLDLPDAEREAFVARLASIAEGREVRPPSVTEALEGAPERISEALAGAAKGRERGGIPYGDAERRAVRGQLTLAELARGDALDPATLDMLPERFREELLAASRHLGERTGLGAQRANPEAVNRLAELDRLIAQAEAGGAGAGMTPEQAAEALLAGKPLSELGKGTTANDLPALRAERDALARQLEEGGEFVPLIDPSLVGPVAPEVNLGANAEEIAAIEAEIRRLGERRAEILVQARMRGQLSRDLAEEQAAIAERMANLGTELEGLKPVVGGRDVPLDVLENTQRRAALEARLEQLQRQRRTPGAQLTEDELIPEQTVTRTVTEPGVAPEDPHLFDRLVLEGNLRSYRRVDRQSLSKAELRKLDRRIAAAEKQLAALPPAPTAEPITREVTETIPGRVARSTRQVPARRRPDVDAEIAQIVDELNQLRRTAPGARSRPASKFKGEAMIDPETVALQDHVRRLHEIAAHHARAVQGGAVPGDATLRMVGLPILEAEHGAKREMLDQTRRALGLDTIDAEVSLAWKELQTEHARAMGTYEARKRAMQQENRAARGTRALDQQQRAELRELKPDPLPDETRWKRMQRQRVSDRLGRSDEGSDAATRAMTVEFAKVMEPLAQESMDAVKRYDRLRNWWVRKTKKLTPKAAAAAKPRREVLPSGTEVVYPKGQGIEFAGGATRAERDEARMLARGFGEGDVEAQNLIENARYEAFDLKRIFRDTLKRFTGVAWDSPDVNRVMRMVGRQPKMLMMGDTVVPGVPALRELAMQDIEMTARAAGRELDDAALRAARADIEDAGGLRKLMQRWAFHKTGDIKWLSDVNENRLNRVLGFGVGTRSPKQHGLRWVTTELSAANEAAIAANSTADLIDEYVDTPRLQLLHRLFEQMSPQARARLWDHVSERARSEGHELVELTERVRRLGGAEGTEVLGDVGETLGTRGRLAPVADEAQDLSDYWGAGEFESLTKERQAYNKRLAQLHLEPTPEELMTSGQRQLAEQAAGRQAELAPLREQATGFQAELEALTGQQQAAAAARAEAATLPPRHEEVFAKLQELQAPGRQQIENVQAARGETEAYLNLVNERLANWPPELREDLSSLEEAHRVLGGQIDDTLGYADQAQAIVERAKARVKASKGLNNVGKNKRIESLDSDLGLLRAAIDGGADEQTVQLLGAATHARGRLGELENKIGQVEQAVKDANSGKLGEIVQTEVADGLQMFKSTVTGRQLVGEPEVIQALTKLDEFVREPGAFGKVLDAYTRFFKTYATLTPGYHVRNGIGATIMNASDGVSTLNQIAAPGVWASYIRDPLGKWWEKVPAKYQDIAQDALKAVYNSGAGGQFSSPEIISRAMGKAGGKGRRIFTNNPLVKGSRWAGEQVEGAARMAMALDTLQKGGTVDEAVARINRVHFNYSHVSEMDEKARRLIPFWTFMSRNLPLQVQQMATKPRTYAHWNAFKQNFGMDEEGMQPMPQWMREAGGIRLGQGLAALPDIGPTQLRAYAEMVGRPSKIVSQFNPAAKVPLQIVSNYDFFRGRPYDPNEFQPPGELGLLGPLLQYVGAEETAGGTALPRKSAEQIRNLIPTLGLINRMGGTTPDREALTQQALLNFLGVPIRQLTPEVMERERRYQKGSQFYRGLNAEEKQEALAEFARTGR